MDLSDYLPKKKKPRRRLVDIDIEEISLVDRGANKQSFAVIKRRTMMELVEILKEFVGPDELTDEEIERAKTLSEDAAKAVAKALKLLNKYKDDMPEDVLSAIKTLTKLVGSSGGDYGYPPKKTEKRASIFELLKSMRDEDNPQGLSAWEQLALVLHGPEIEQKLNEKAAAVAISKQLEELPEEDEDELRKTLDDPNVPFKEKLDRLLELGIDPWPSLQLS